MRRWKDEYKIAQRQAREMARIYGTSSDIIVHLSLTSYGRKQFMSMNRRLYEDAELDRELGVISEDEYKLEIDTYSIIENSIAEACVY